MKVIECKELATAMKYTSASAKNVGVELPELISYIGTVSSVTRRSAETIGQSYKTIFARYEDIKQGKTFDAENEPLSNVEASFNKLGIAIRKDVNTFKDFNIVLDELAIKWKSMSDIEKSDITKSLAGVRQRESLLVLLDNYDTMTNLQKAMTDSTGSAQKKFDEAYGKSTEAKVNDLKNSMEQLWISMIKSDTINVVVGGITNLVQWLNELVTSCKLSGIELIGLGIAMLSIIRNFSVFNTAIITIMPNIANFIKLLFQFAVAIPTANMSGLASLFPKLATGISAVLSPATAVIAVLSLLTISIVKHVQYQKELHKQTQQLTTDYQNLTKAMKENDSANIQSNVDKVKPKEKELQELLKRRVELQKEIKEESKKTDYDFKANKTGVYAGLNIELKNTNERIKELNDSLAQSGFHYNETTGKIMELSQAETMLANSSVAEHLKEQSQKAVEHRKYVLGLITEYKDLNSIQNKNAKQKERLSQLSYSLNENIKGLNIVVDENGKATIKNNSILDEHIKLLTKENEEEQSNLNGVMDSAKAKAQAQVGYTLITYEEIKKRISMYEEEQKALMSLIDMKIAEGSMDDNSARKYFKSSSFINSKLDELKSAKSSIDEIFKTKYEEKNKNTSEESYTPPDDGSSSSNIVEADSKTSQYINSLNTILDKYKNIDKTLESIKTNQDEISKVNTDKAKIESLNQMNKLYDKQIDKLKQLQFDNSTQQGSMRSLMGQIENEYRSKYKDSYGLGEKTEEWFKDIGVELFPTQNFTNSEDSKAYEQRKKDYDDFVANYIKLREQVQGLGNDAEATRNEIVETLKAIGELGVESQFIGFDKQLSDNATELSKLGNIDTESEKLDEVFIELENLEIYKNMADTSQEILNKNRVLYNSAMAKNVSDLTDEEIRVITEYETALKRNNDALINLVQSEDKITELYTNSLVEPYEKRIKDINDNISLLGNVDTDEEKVQLISYYKAMGEELQKQLSDIQGNIERNKLILVDPKSTKEQINVATKMIDSLKDEEVQIKINIKSNAEEIESQLKEVARQYIELEKENEEKKLDNYITKRKSELEDEYNVFEELHKKKIDAYDKEIEALERISDQESESEERLKRQNDLLKKQTEIEKTKNDRNIVTYKQQADGSYQIEYIYDVEKVEQLQEEYNEMVTDNNSWEREQNRKHQKQELEDKKKAEQELIDTKKESLDKQLSELESYELKEKDRISKHYNNIDKLVGDLLTTLKTTYGNKWDEILIVLDEKLKSAKEKFDLLNSYANNATETTSGISFKNYKITVTTEQGESETKILTPEEYNSDSVQSNLQDLRDMGLKVDIQQFGKGGMTADWSDGNNTNGKLAILHPNEVINNPVESGMLLKATEILDSINLDSIKNLVNNIPKINIPKFDFIKSSNATEQHFYIDKLEFPSITNDSGVQNLVDNLRQLPRLARQFAK